jgi:hypothetical protein
MASTAADVLVETLQDWGVEVVFGMPGDGINGIMEALRIRRETIRFIQVRHEESAAFMACAWAKYTGRLGVCLATSGPGGLHLLDGLYDAKLDRQPVLAITGHHYHDLTSSSTRSRARPGLFRSTWTPCGSASAIPSRSAWSANRGSRCGYPRGHAQSFTASRSARRRGRSVEP